MKIFLMNTSWNIFYTDIWWNQICGRRGVRWIRIRLIQNRSRRSTEKNILISFVMAVYTNAACFRRSVREADNWLSSDWATGSNKNEKTFTEWGFWMSDLWPVKVFSVMCAIYFATRVACLEWQSIQWWKSDCEILLNDCDTNKNFVC